MRCFLILGHKGFHGGTGWGSMVFYHLVQDDMCHVFLLGNMSAHSLFLSLPLNPSEGIRAAFVRCFYRWFEKWGYISSSEGTFILGCSQRKGQVQITSVPSGAIRICDTQYIYIPCIELVRTDGQGVHVENWAVSAHWTWLRVQFYRTE